MSTHEREGDEEEEHEAEEAEDGEEGEGEEEEEEDRHVAFPGIPSWQALCSSVEELYLELRAEDFCLKHGRITLSEQLWPGLAAGRTALTLWVISLCKPFTDFMDYEAYDILNTATLYAEDDAAQFPLADYNPHAPADAVLQACLGFQEHADIVAHVGRELALQRCHTSPYRARKGDSTRDFISPVIFAAAALAGNMRVEADYSICGALGKGRIDYVMVYRHFPIVVVEGKLHETQGEHLGQLAAGMRAAREQFQRVLAKRKHDEEGDFKQVPSFGIISNGMNYNFFKFTPGDRTLLHCATSAQLTLDMPAEAASKEVLPIIRRLVHVIHQHVQCMDSFHKGRSG